MENLPCSTGLLLFCWSCGSELSGLSYCKPYTPHPCHLTCSRWLCALSVICILCFQPNSWWRWQMHCVLWLISVYWILISQSQVLCPLVLWGPLEVQVVSSQRTCSHQPGGEIQIVDKPVPLGILTFPWSHNDFFLYINCKDRFASLSWHWAHCASWRNTRERIRWVKNFALKCFLPRCSRQPSVSSLLPFGQKDIIQLGLLLLHKTWIVFICKKSPELELSTWQFSPWGACLVGQQLQSFSPERIPHAMSVPVSVNKEKGQVRIIYASCSASCVFWNSVFLQKICAFCFNNNSPSSLNFKSLHSLNQDEFFSGKAWF